MVKPNAWLKNAEKTLTGILIFVQNICERHFTNSCRDIEI